ncbi:hypothetical protein [Sphingobacterium bambusae]|uniref:Outer membrane protein beta-barrel domain-containing protein n=1 Tax=Sphingobacterium bambusae TaxID=662858 RepID=A0ABW6BIF6_9SPHI|nr:hypothetical protein [Sphingobacterium bambusae]WPL50977.1 hypothetical protein SCB77_11005 [Sphingobacterium bambusae]
MHFFKHFVLFFLFFFCWSVKAQERKISLGVVSDFQLESPSYDLYYGVQGKYDLTNRQALQLQAGFSNANIGFVGADYIYNLFLFKRNPLIYVGAGTAYEYLTNGAGNEIAFNGQAGVQFTVRRFEPYIGFKSKFYFQAEAFDPGYINFGLRFRL